LNSSPSGQTPADRPPLPPPPSPPLPRALLMVLNNADALQQDVPACLVTAHAPGCWRTVGCMPRTATAFATPLNIRGSTRCVHTLQHARRHAHPSPHGYHPACLPLRLRFQPVCVFCYACVGDFEHRRTITLVNLIRSILSCTHQLPANVLRTYFASALNLPHAEHYSPLAAANVAAATYRYPDGTRRLNKTAGTGHK